MASEWRYSLPVSTALQPSLESKLKFQIAESSSFNLLANLVNNHKNPANGSEDYDSRPLILNMYNFQACGRTPYASGIAMLYIDKAHFAGSIRFFKVMMMWVHIV